MASQLRAQVVSSAGIEGKDASKRVTNDSDRQDRRRYPRLRAAVYCRPVGPLAARGGQPIDLGLGGVRVYSDDPMEQGSRLEVELRLPDDSTLTLLSEVVWVQELPEHAPASYDVGLQFLDLTPEDVEALASVLARSEP
jgi:hypothetical protein